VLDALDGKPPRITHNNVLEREIAFSVFATTTYLPRHYTQIVYIYLMCHVLGEEERREHNGIGLAYIIDPFFAIFRVGKHPRGMRAGQGGEECSLLALSRLVDSWLLPALVTYGR
jgi:hypothetical protein